jgi:hypothetical protein
MACAGWVSRDATKAPTTPTSPVEARTGWKRDHTAQGIDLEERLFFMICGVRQVGCAMVHQIGQAAINRRT